MKRFITYYILCLFLFLGNGHAFALQYQTRFLKKAVQKMALDSLLETKAGKNVAKYFDFKGTKMVAHYDGNAMVDHLGVVLFSETMKKENPSPIYDFLERAYLDHIYKVSDNNLYLNNIQFQVGSWDSFKKINASVPCSVNNGMDKFYTVKWQQNGKTLLSLAFLPIMSISPMTLAETWNSSSWNCFEVSSRGKVWLRRKSTSMTWGKSRARTYM